MWRRASFGEASHIHRPSPRDLPLRLTPLGRRPGHYQAFLNLLRHAHRWDAARKGYGDLKVPVLVVYGELDWSRPDERRRTVAAIPNAKMETIPEAGHFLSLDQPKRLADLIASFAKS